jgi:hypothetical protein
VAWAGVAPDLDGVSAVFGADVYGRYHHVLTHGIVAALAVSVLVAFLARQRLKTALFAFVAFHVHLGCDLLGSGTGWSLTYLFPFSRWDLYTPYGWQLASWQNAVITLAALLFCCYVGVRYGYTVAEAILPKAWDLAVVRALRQRFAKAKDSAP